MPLLKTLQGLLIIRAKWTLLSFVLKVLCDLAPPRLSTLPPDPLSDNQADPACSFPFINVPSLFLYTAFTFTFSISPSVFISPNDQLVPA